MWRALSVALCLSSTAATATETARGLAIWNEPLPLVITPLGYSGLALGANIPFNPDNDLVVEVMPFLIRERCDAYCGGRGIFAAVGVSYRLFQFGGGPRDGFFVQPKLVVHAQRDDYAFGSLSHEDSFSVAVGADIGYRMTFGNVFVAPILGAALGYASSFNDYFPRLFPLIVFGPFRSPWSEPSLGFDLNIHLLRIGFAF